MALDLDSITSGYNLGKINSNFQKVEDAINDDTLKREISAGDSNEMRTHLDMNSNKISNLSPATLPQDALTLAQQNLIVKNITNGDLMSIARSLSVLDAQVISSDNTTDILDSVLYIYDVAAQKVYAKPADVGAGEVISSVSGGVLTTDITTYTLLPFVSTKTINEQGILVWDSETVYAVDALTLGSDGTIYQALSSQKGNDPTSSPGQWQELSYVLTKGGFSNEADEANTFITGENFAGDTAVALDLSHITCQRIGGTAVISGRMVITGFSITLPEDTGVSFTYDLETKAQEEGWFQSITAISHGTAILQYHEVGVSDQPAYGMTLEANTGGLDFSSVENTSPGAITVDELRVNYTIVVNVGD